MTIKIGMNGFGRIGRSVVRAWVERDFPFELVLVNELADVQTNAYLLKYDSVHGRCDAKIEAHGNEIRVDNRSIQFSSHRNPGEIPWSKVGVDIVLECTGFFTKRDQAAEHLKAGAKKVLISAPAKDPDITVACGINLEKYDPLQHHILSNASCTTNCLAPVAKVLNDTFGIEHGLMTTIHSYTNDQRILDVAHEDPRRARAAALSQIPTKTGAAAAVGLVLPELAGKIDGLAIRVPTPNVSCTDFVCRTKNPVTVESVNLALAHAAEGYLNGILGFCTEPLVSIDFNGSKYSSIVDAESTKVMDQRLVKVLAWYDNETGFSHRMVDVALYLAKHFG